MSLRVKSRLVFVVMILGLSLSYGCGEAPTHFRSLDDSGGTPTDASADAAPQYLKTFTAGQLESASLAIDSGFKLIQQDFSLIKAPKTAEISQQIDRRLFEDVFIQGHSGTPAQQSFAIAEAGIFDLLIVIDNSSSMGPYQNRLSHTLPSILRYISNTNWRIAVVTSTSPCLVKTDDKRRYITRADFDRDPVATEADFKKLTMIGEGGDPIEKGIKMMTDAMTSSGCSSESNDWLRANSQRSILLLTDEKNCGSGDTNEGCPGAPWETASYFFDRVGFNVPVNAFLLLQEPPRIDPNNPNDPNRDCENSGGYLNPPNPSEYVRLVQETGGIYNDVCRANYQTVLEQISQNVRKKVNIQFELSYPAVSTSLDVSIDGKKVNSFTVSGKTLTILETVNETAQTITVNYKHDPVPMLKNFMPQHNHDSASIDVFINGEALAKTLYHYNEISSQVELNNIPAEMAQIKLRYRENVPLRKNFSYTADFVPDSLEVWVDEKKISDFVHDPVLKKVTLNPPPADGKSIALRYEMPGDRKLNYPIIGADAGHIENFKLIDRDTGLAVNATVKQGELLLDNGDIVNGRPMRATYNMDYAFKDKLYSIGITAPPYPGTLKIDAEGDDKVCSQNIEVHEDKLDFTCSDEDFEKLNISYQFASDYKNSFDINVAYSGPKTFKVYINGQESSSFHIIEDRLVILKKDLPAGAEVKVLIQPK